jgi:lipoprotein-anchoring transpeptidase ErfK/SrfK
MTTRRNVLLALAGLATTASAEAAVSKTPIADKKPAKAKKSVAKAKTKPKAPAKKRLIISINKVSQKMTVSLDGDTKFVWPVSTGAKGYDTPSGNYRPFRLEKEHFSKEWDDAPMPYSIFFTARGHAVHGSYHVKSLGRRASHGCVRLAPDNAAKLFALVGQTGMSNTAVIVKGGFFDGGFRDDQGNVKKRKSIFPWENRT